MLVPKGRILTMKKKNEFKNPAQDTRVATKADLLACILSACVMLLIYMGLAEYTRFANLYSGICCVIGYLLFLSLWTWRRMKKDPVVFDNSMIALLNTPLGQLVEKLDSPAMICDEHGNLCWYNKSLAPWIRANDVLIGTSVNSIFKVEGERRRVEIGKRMYSFDAVGTTSEGKNYIFILLTDCTELIELENKYNGERVAVAFISLDNIEEVMQYAHENFRDAVAEVDEKIRHWIESVGGIIKSYDNDKYIVFFDSSKLDGFIDNRFEILDSVRSTHIGDGISVTISMGVSRVSGSLAERQAAAQSALDMALQRGGDQVVYKHDNGIDYYGGRTKGVYKKTNVKARLISRQISTLVTRADNVIIMGHSFGDFDSFGACIGAARLCFGYGAQPLIAIDSANDNFRNCFAKAEILNDYHGIFVDRKQALEHMRKDTLLIIVDVNNFAYTEFPELVEHASAIAVIDHHIQTAEFPPKVKLGYIEPSASSASELVAEMLELGMGSVNLHKEEAELLLAGILLDTKRFTRNTGTRTFSVARYLRGEGADPIEASNLFRVDADSFYKESRFTSAIQIYRGNIAIATVEEDTDPSYRVLAAEASDRMLSISGIEASFALVRIDNVTYISARSDGTVNVQLILEKLKGGGHFDVAGAQVRDADTDSVLADLIKSIDEYFDKK
jgi:c-di-AMP phosphodiesterase-like protein